MTDLRSGLHMYLPQLAEDISAMPPEARRKLVIRACERALQIAGVTIPEAALGLRFLNERTAEGRQRLIGTLTDIAEMLDEKYLEAWDDDNGDRTRTAAETRLAMALHAQWSAVSALAHALKEDLGSQLESLADALATVAGQHQPNQEHVRQILGELS